MIAWLSQEHKRPKEAMQPHFLFLFVSHMLTFRWQSKPHVQVQHLCVGDLSIVVLRKIHNRAGGGGGWVAVRSKEQGIITPSSTERGRVLGWL